MRVCNYLELAGPLQRSGIGTAARQQRRALERAAPELDVVTSPWRGGDPRSAIGGVLHGNPPVREFDLLHCNLFGPGSAFAARTARQRDVPLICHAHSTGEDFAGSFRGSSLAAPVLRRYLRRFYSAADLVLAPSGYAADLLRANEVDAPVRVLSNGVDLDALDGYESFREPYRERYDLSGTVVFTVGNVFERKGLTDFCELGRELQGVESGRGGPYEFVWFGPYDDGPRASAAVRKWTGDPPANVTFTGWVDEIRGAYGAGDIYLFATKEETQGIAALEAMACGKPCVLRDLPVFREYYEHGHDCLLAADRAEMREAVERLATDPELAARLGKNARKTAEKHRLEAVGEELAGIYADLLAGDLPAAAREPGAGAPGTPGGRDNGSPTDDSPDHS